MFHKLRKQLTLVCAVGTSLILLGMATVSFGFSAKQLRGQYSQRFAGSVQSVYHVLRTQPVIDHAWLLETEKTENIMIGIQSGEYNLLFTGNAPWRQQLASLALETAIDRHDFQQAAQPIGLYTTESTQFNLRTEYGRYRAAVAAITVNEGWVSVIILQDLAEETGQIRILLAQYIASVVLASACMLLFAWFFTGKAVRPVEVSRKKQTAFVSAASHEFRAPLAVIQMGAEGIAGASPQKAGENARVIIKECDRLKRLTEDLLQLAGADNHSWSMQYMPVNPEAIVLNAVDEFLQLAKAEGTKLTPQLPEDLLPKILCDKQRMEQVLAVLLDNALRFAPRQGQIVVSLRQEQKQVCITVADNGPGIPDGQKEQVFDRFYQGDRSRSSKEHFGLGLSIAKEIVEHHRGEITVVDSELGGAAFIIRLPVWDG